MSLMFSIPTASRTRPGVTPAADCSSGVSCEWVVDAGWMTSDLTSPMLATWLCSSRPSTNRLPASIPPAISKLRTAPVPLGAYVRPRSYHGLPRQTCVVDLLDLVAGGEIFRDGLRVLRGARCAGSTSPRPWRRQPGVERRRAAQVTQQLHPALRMYDRFAPNCEPTPRSRAYTTRGSWGRVEEFGESLGILRVVERAAVDDHAGNRSAVPADVLRRRVDDDVGAPLQRLDQVRRGPLCCPRSAVPRTRGPPRSPRCRGCRSSDWRCSPRRTPSCWA